MSRPCVLALCVLLGLLDSAQAGFIKITVGDPTLPTPTATTVETSLPTSINAGDSFQFDLLLVGAKNLGQYGFALTLYSDSGTDMAAEIGSGGAFFISASNELSPGVLNPRYVFGTDSLGAFSYPDLLGNKVTVTIGDLANTEVPATVEGAKDLLATYTVTTSAAFTGNLRFSISTAESDLFFTTLGNSASDPISNFASIKTSLQAYDVNAGGTSLKVAVEGSTVNPVPEPSSVTLGLVGLTTILCGRRFARRLVALPNG